MEVHKPKPVHGWRELLNEIMIIVVGVLIALAGEQAVEWAHWREEARQAEEAMRRDADEILRGMLLRLEIQDCQDRRLVLIHDRLLGSGPDWTPMSAFYTSGPPAGSIYAHPMISWPQASWLNAVASTAATHLPRERLIHYASIFAVAQRLESEQAIEHELSSELNLLGSPLTLTPEARIGLLRVVEGERARNRLMGFEARGGLRHFQSLNFDVAGAETKAHKNLAYTTCAANKLL